MNYYFLDDIVYSPKEVKVSFGKEVKIDKRKGDEIWFSFVGTNIKGYVVYPKLFAEKNKENRFLINLYKRDIKESEKLEKQAFFALDRTTKLA